MTKITPDHLTRQAIVYIRQSTADQVVNNLESKRRQYNLPERARQLGWSDVAIIDDDLGRSGSGIARPGFEKLLAAICEGRVGAVVSVEASRLARNGRDWHTLLEFCGLVGTLIVDEDGVYDPRHPNDRLLLGMKGTMSEMELSLFRQRSVAALKQKAGRGELFMTVAIGYLKVAHDRIEKDPDRRIQEAIDLVFARFAELQTVRQVHLWLRQEAISLPAVVYGAEGRRIEWKLPPVAGLGGGFRFCELGEPLFDEAGKIRESVRFADLARHVYFTETGEPLPRERVGKSPLLGVTSTGVAVYLLYNGILKDKSVDGGNVLTRATLALLPPYVGPRVVYAAGCRFSPERLKRENIFFKQTPYAIRLQ